MSHHQPSRDTAEFYAQYRPSAAGDVDLAKQIMLAPGGMETLLREAKVRMTATGAVNGSSVDEALLKLLVQVEANGARLPAPASQPATSLPACLPPTCAAGAQT